MKKDSHWDETVDRPWIGKSEDAGRRLIYKLMSGLGSDPDRAFDMNRVKKILLVKEPYRMGDLFQVTPTLRALKAWKKDLFVGLVIQDRNLPVFQNNQRIDRLFLYEKRAVNRNPLKILSLMRSIRREKFDLAVTLETQRTHLTNDLIAYYSGAPYRLRYGGKAFGNADSDAFYNLHAPFDPSAQHQVDKNFGVFKKFGFQLDDRTLEFFVSDEELARAKHILESLRLKSPILTIHPGSYKLNNRWPLANYIQVAQTLRGQGRAAVFVLGPSESDWRPEIEQAGFSVVTGISVGVMAGIFKLSGQVICNDTGVMHISGAVGAGTLALFGETEPDQWKPPGEAVRFLRAADHKIGSIRVDEVLEVI